MPAVLQPGRHRSSRPVTTAVAVAVALCSAACLPEVDAPTPSTMPAAAPATTLVPIDLGGVRAVDHDQPVEFTGPMLDGTELTVRSDDPSVRFVDGEPAEIRRITDLAAGGECEQLHATVQFWLSYATDDDDTGDAAGRRASLFGRAAYDAIIFVGCP
jgi:hypothetical protein